MPSCVYSILLRRKKKCFVRKVRKMKPRSKRFYIILSVAAALATMTVKFTGYFLTGSVGLFSDAAESVVNLIAALVALWAITLAARPADEEITDRHTESE